mmetsp:Transcript_15378/g.31853  ORF Transcript_15378/g.31853 Transcript_15378/m.31853 type:complete len:139 (-) Transcript_15378:1351-1767(-)
MLELNGNCHFLFIINDRSKLTFHPSVRLSNFFYHVCVLLHSAVDKFIAAMNEAIEPRLNGKNLETLDEFKELFPKIDLMEGDEIELTIRGDTLLLKTGLGVGTISSRPFTEALCDVYFGKDPVSPTLKQDVLKGVPAL